MRTSKFNITQKRTILNEYKYGQNTINEICAKYKISVTTFYIWKKNLLKEDTIKEIIISNQSISENEIQNENKILRKLYVKLSAHNHELAKFLEK